MSRWHEDGQEKDRKPATLNSRANGDTQRSERLWRRRASLPIYIKPCQRDLPCWSIAHCGDLLALLSLHNFPIKLTLVSPSLHSQNAFICQPYRPGIWACWASGPFYLQRPKHSAGKYIRCYPHTSWTWFPPITIGCVVILVAMTKMERKSRMGSGKGTKRTIRTMRMMRTGLASVNDYVLLRPTVSARLSTGPKRRGAVEGGWDDDVEMSQFRTLRLQTSTMMIFRWIESRWWSRKILLLTTISTMHWRCTLNKCWETRN